MTFSELPSKAAQLRLMQEKLSSDERWILRGLFAIYARQTADEQLQGNNTHHNGMGFTVHDADYLTQMCQQAMARGAEADLRNKAEIKLEKYFSAKQAAVVIRKMQKYANQLCIVAREK